nr:hypothetical protein [Tanacetum cinerariifolium]
MQHVFSVLNVKPFEITFLDFVELVIIFTYSDPIQMLVVVPFNDLKICDSDDSTFRVDISSKFPVDFKSIELLTFAPPMRDSPKSIFVIANCCLSIAWIIVAALSLSLCLQMIFHTPLDDDASCEHSQRDIKRKAFINREIDQLTLNQEMQHVFSVLNVKPFE